jgi:superfamily I DNA/RNA helicase
MSRIYGEIINPSDPYTIEISDWQAACVAVALLSRGMYGLTALDDSDRRMPPLMLGGGKKFFAEIGIDDLKAWLRVPENNLRMAAALDTVVIGDRDLYDSLTEGKAPEELKAFNAIWHDKIRSSLNNIGGSAEAFAAQLREEAEVPA